MGQTVLTAVLALAFAVTLTAAMAFATCAQAAQKRAIGLTAIATTTALTMCSFRSANFRMNFTNSMPVGVYSVVWLPPGGVQRGMLVAACAPPHAAEQGRQRGYLGAGPCADGTEVLLKFVAAVAGDMVDVTPRGVDVNGCLLLHSRPEPRDRNGRTLVPWPRGAHRLANGQAWLYAPTDRSWDSRYWGPAFTADIHFEAARCCRLRLPTHGSSLRCSLCLRSFDETRKKIIQRF